MLLATTPPGVDRARQIEQPFDPVRQVAPIDRQAAALADRLDAQQESQEGAVPAIQIRDRDDDVPDRRRSAKFAQRGIGRRDANTHRPFAREREGHHAVRAGRVFNSGEGLEI